MQREYNDRADQGGADQTVQPTSCLEGFGHGQAANADAGLQQADVNFEVTEIQFTSYTFQFSHFNCFRFWYIQNTPHRILNLTMLVRIVVVMFAVLWRYLISFGEKIFELTSVLSCR